MKLWQRQPGYAWMELSPANYKDWKSMSHSFDDVAAFTNVSHNIVSQDEPERVAGEHITSGLLLRALWRLQAVDPGFRAEGVLSLRTWLPWPLSADTEKRTEFYHRVLNEATRLPGVSGAAYISFLPMTMTGGIWPVAIRGETVIWDPSRLASMRFHFLCA